MGLIENEFQGKALEMMLRGHARKFPAHGRIEKK